MSKRRELLIFCLMIAAATALWWAGSEVLAEIDRRHDAAVAAGFKSVGEQVEAYRLGFSDPQAFRDKQQSDRARQRANFEFLARRDDEEAAKQAAARRAAKPN